MFWLLHVKVWQHFYGGLKNEREYYNDRGSKEGKYQNE